MSAAHVVIGQEHHTQLFARIGVPLEHLTDGIDQPDDELGHVIAGRCLAAEDERAGRGITMASGLEAYVLSNHLQDVQMLALVLMDAFDLHVEHRLRIHRNPRALPHERLEFGFVRLLHLPPLFAEACILCQRLEPCELLEVGYPLLANRIADECGEPRVAQCHPASWCHAVGLVAELLRPQRIKILQHILLEQLGMQLCNSVDRMAAHAGEIGHAHIALPAFVDDG